VSIVELPTARAGSGSRNKRRDAISSSSTERDTPMEAKNQFVVISGDLARRIAASYVVARLSKGTHVPAGSHTG
jgi:hypothetical protein